MAGGFFKGHKAYYTGGALPGHAPTNLDGNAAALPNMNDPSNPAYAWRFDQELGKRNRERGGNRTKDRERMCLEAIQNGRTDRDLAGRFPPGMLKRLRALDRVASDADHDDFMQAQRLVREILTTHRGDRAGEPGASATIQILHGHSEAPMPGSVIPPAAGGGAAGGAEEGGGQSSLREPPSEGK